MKRQLFILLILLYVASPLFSQVAINNTGADPDGSAILDLSSNDKGLLLPRMVINDVDSDMSPVESPAQGLLIYNTGSAQVEEGIYSWSGDKWVKIINSNSSLNVNQVSSVYESAEMYEVNEINNSTFISLPVSDNYYGWTTATEGTTFGSMTTDVNNADGSRIIIGETGLYQIVISASIAGSNNNIITGSVFHTPDGGSPVITRVRFISRIQNATDVVSGSAQGVLLLNENDAIDLRFSSASWGENVEIFIMNISCTKVGN